MQYYFAPLEGITTYIYRNTHKKYYKGIDKYFMPFVSPTMHGSFTPRERKDVIPEHNKEITVIPQILTNNAEYFIQTAKELKEYGYTEVNLTLGCPSNTVVTKCKGAGFLSETYRLERFLDEIFAKCDMKISVKTRIGRYEEEEFEDLLPIYNKFPMEELIIHPRVQQDYYKNPIHMDCFLDAVAKSKNSICYNGDLFTIEDYENLLKQAPNIDKVMFGRGVIGNPALVQEIRYGDLVKDRTEQREVFWKFHNEMFELYQQEIGNNALFKMKELWVYMSRLFPEEEKSIKKIKKAQKIRDYEIAMTGLRGE